MSKVDKQLMELEWRAHNKKFKQQNGLVSCQFATLEAFIDYRLGRGKKANAKTTKGVYKPESKTFVRESPKIKSVVTKNTTTGYASKKASPQYSGDYIVGIATMHKSNLVAVGKGDDPVSYSTMRRG
jgi:hypothetical protein